MIYNASNVTNPPAATGCGVGCRPEVLMLGAELRKWMYACFPARRTFIQRSVAAGVFEKLGKVYTTTEDGSMGEKGYVDTA